MPSVGRAEVEIVADFTKFGRNLQRQLQKEVDKVKVDSSKVGEGIGDGIGDGVERGTRALRTLPTVAKKALGETEDTARQVGKRIGDGFEETYKRLRSVFSKLSNVLFTFRSRAILFGGAITIAIAGIVAATDELLGLLLPLPAVLAGVGVAIATLNVVLSGMGEAFKAAGEDTEKFESVIAELAPSAQHVVREFRNLRPVFQSIRVDVQEAFWSQLNNTLTKLVTILAGPLRRGMIDVADAMGNVVQEFARFAGAAETVRVLEIVFANTAESVDNIAAATVPFLEGMRTLVEVFAPKIAAMTEDLAAGAESFRDWAAEAQRSGEALERFEQAAEFVRTLGYILGGAFRLVGAGIQASHEAGVDLFQTIGDLIDQAADLSDTVEAQEGLRQFFQSIDQLIRALLPVLGAAAVQIGRLVNPLADLVEALAPGVKAAFEGIADALIALVDSGGREFAEALSDAFITLAPHLEVVGQLAGELLESVAPLLDPLARLIGFILELAAGIALLLVPFVEPLTEFLAAVLTPLFEILLRMAETALPPLAEAFERLTEAVTPLVAMMGGLLLEVIETLLLPQNLALLEWVVLRIVDAILFWTAVWGGVLEVMERIWGWVKENIIPILKEGLWPLIRDELTPALLELRGAFEDLWEEIVETGEVIGDLIGYLIEEFDPELVIARLIIYSVYGAVVILRSIIISVTTGIKNLTTAIKPLVKAWGQAATGAKNLYNAVRALRTIGGDLIGTLKGIVDRGLRVVNTLKSMVQAARNAASAISNIPSLPSGLGRIFDFFADGGIVTRATAAIIGEAGPEVVLPLSDPARSRELAAESGLMDVLLSGSSSMTTARRAGSSSSAGGAGATSVVVEEGAVVVQFNGGVPDEQRARRVGQAAGEGLLNTLAARNVRLAIRGI